METFCGMPILMTLSSGITAGYNLSTKAWSKRKHRGRSPYVGSKVCIVMIRKKMQYFILSKLQRRFSLCFGILLYLYSPQKFVQTEHSPTSKYVSSFNKLT